MIRFLSLVLGTAFIATASGASPLPSAAGSATPGEDRFEQVHSLVEGFVTPTRYAGAVMLILQDGKVADVRAYGYRNLEARLPMERDTIMHVCSMTKIVTAVAVMQLVEEGRIGLDDPIAKYIPELGNRKVIVGPDQFVRARPITIRHLLTHTSGLAYDFSAEGPVAPYYAISPFDAPSLKGFILNASKLPLENQPGDRFVYSCGFDVLGYLVEVVSGMPFDRYVHDRILGPLKMDDTSFQVPAEKSGRRARIYSVTPAGVQLPVMEGTAKDICCHIYPCGGSGLYSTADDYARFAQMFLNGGELDGARILKPETIRAMTTDQLTHVPPTPFLDRGTSYGLGVGVRTSVPEGPVYGSIGQFGWDGAATTYFWIDPKTRSAALLLIQHFPFEEFKIFHPFAAAVQQALTKN